MPTDRERLTHLLDDLGIVYKADPDLPGPDRFVVVAGDGPKQDGYSGFVVNFDFTNEGEFVELGIWE